MSSTTYYESLRWDWSPEEIEQTIDQELKNIEEVYDRVGATPVDDCSFDNVLQELSLIDGEHPEFEAIGFLQYVSTDEKVREASRAAEKKSNEFWIRMAQREDIYERVKYISEQKNQNMSPDQRRLLEHSMRGFRRLGLELPSEKRAKLKELLDRQSELQIKFAGTISEDTTHQFLETSELAGMDPQFLERTREKDESENSVGDGNRHKVTCKYPDVYPVLQFCTVSETRRKVLEMYEGRCQENFKVLEELVNIRQSRADLLGFANNSDFQLEILMGKTQEKVLTFLRNLAQQLRPYTDEYHRVLANLKSMSEFNRWDYSFYHNQNLRNNYSLDHQKLKEYFPADHVLTEMLDIYSNLFGVTFTEVDITEGNTNGENTVWHNSVRYFRVDDTASGDRMGYFYLDLYPRDGKYTHAAAFGLASGHQNRSCQQVMPVRALVCNFTEPTESTPSLLPYHDVSTLFHEFGHIIHGICGGWRQRFREFSGTRVETDFVEAPSQMIEQWLWEPVILRRISKHYQTGEQISDSLMERLVSTKYVGKSRDWSRQCCYALTDQTVHSQGGLGSEDIMNIYEKVHKEYLGFDMGRGKMMASWGHMGSGYDSKYFSYVWSIVIAADLYSRFLESGDPLSKKIGMEYRKYIMEPGGSVDAEVMVRNFLGRDFQLESFLRSIGLKA